MRSIPRENSLREQALGLLEGVKQSPPERSERCGLATELAALLVELARLKQTSRERARARLLERMMNDPEGQAFTQALTDRTHRPRAARKVVREVSALLERYGVPRYLGAFARLQLALVPLLGTLAPSLAASGIARRLRHEISPYIIPAEPSELARYLAERRAAKLRINVNRLGEEVIGEAEALRHVAGYVDLLGRLDVETISVKISSLYSQVSLLAWPATLDVLRDRLRSIYRAARATSESKLVYLDMEAYRDLHLALELFRSVLDEPEFKTLSAGIVLQAYIPESAALQRELTVWAKARVRERGAPIRLRIVKGANLAMERVESALRSWPLPTHTSKLQADASYKRMLEYGTEPDNARVVRLGIASHNLFDLAYGLVLRAARGVEESVGFELLEGMASSTCRVLRHVTDDILLYGPMVAESEFTSAVAYLMRRLDENTAPENFLHASFDLEVQSSAFEQEKRKFLTACSCVETISEMPKRSQDRNQPVPSPPNGSTPNEPDTDFSQAHNRAWIFAELERWRDRTLELPLQIAGEELYRDPKADGFDPSRPGRVPYRFALATSADLDRAIATAVQAGAAWALESPEERAEALFNVAKELRLIRGELIACMVLDAGKRIEEADIEVSEAIDFAEYYARSLLELCRYHAVEPKARGVIAVTPPWNFPLAIPLSGVLAALAAGNAVILKPAPETVLVAQRAAQALWRAGIPKRVLQFVAAEDEVASRLITDPRIDGVILTGATATARLFKSFRPSLYLCAETGGKNAFIVTACADRELGIRDLLASAFGHSGQKCSAASLLILEAEVYDDAAFSRKLKDAAESLAVGSAWDPQSYLTPLIRTPQGALERGLQVLDPGEQWLLEPRHDPDNPQLFGPGIKYGVSEGSYSHVSEFFGPVLSVMRAKDLEDALRIANATPYGLTAGLHSLSENEQQLFLSRMNAGNLYINRTITGAIVGRQPFGGRKASCFGPGAKAGGPNYVAQLMRLSPRDLRPDDTEKSEDLAPELRELLSTIERRLPKSQGKLLHAVARNYTRAYQETFAREHDPFQLPGQANVFRYEPCKVLLRIDAGATELECGCSLLAARICAGNVGLSISIGPDVTESIRKLATLAAPELAPDHSEALTVYLREHAIERVRALGEPPEALFRLTANDGVHIATSPVVQEGRFELLHYLREQSRSINTHRYGNLGYRASSREIEA